MDKERHKPGRKKIINGIKKQIICTKKEFEIITDLLKEIRSKKETEIDSIYRIDKSEPTLLNETLNNQ